MLNFQRIAYPAIAFFSLILMLFHLIQGSAIQAVIPFIVLAFAAYLGLRAWKLTAPIKERAVSLAFREQSMLEDFD